MSEHTHSNGISFHRYPEPACRYLEIDGKARVQEVNEVFETRFGEVPSGSRLSRVFETCGMTPPVTARSTESDQFVVETAGEKPSTYTVQQLPPTEAEAGYLLFIGHPDHSTQAETQTSEYAALGIDHVASVISHDLRNPLDVAKARLEAGRELGEDHHFDHVANAHERMERIIQDVLTLARGEDVVTPDETVELRAVATAAWETVETNGATLRIENSLPTVTADSDRVGRLFENLFRNAVEHGRTDDQSVTVTAGKLEDGFYVADNGSGIPPEKREVVTQPGYSSDTHGTGLGLAIVARIVTLHNWSLTVTDSTTGGARFEITGLQ